jgi:preprotein translocase subunit SecA
LPDRVYKNEIGKFKAVVQEIKERQATGQPMLIGTASIDKNEILGELLKSEGIPFNILNAKNHEREAEFIAQAGRRGAVTLATNMAGRGVDIILGGNPPSAEEAEEVKKLGGLHVLGTERHESRRIDNQLRGRAGRQGDPGSTQFYVSMEDDLMRIFGSDKMKKRMDMFGLPDDQPIESRVLSRAIETAQKKVEGHNFDIRKHLLDYDDVLNRHRTVIYQKRRAVIEQAAARTQEGERETKKLVLQSVEGEIEQTVLFHTAAEDSAAWDMAEVEKACTAIFQASVDVKGRIQGIATGLQGKQDIAAKRTQIIESLMDIARQTYAEIEEKVGDSVRMAEVEKALLLHAIDMLWVEHLEAMDHLRHGIGLQGYGQRDPLVEYKREAYRLFNELLAVIDKQVAGNIFKIQVVRETAQPAQPMAAPRNLQLSGPSKDALASAGTSAVSRSEFEKAGRNDPCPCGSGKKFKKCHGQ